MERTNIQEEAPRQPNVAIEFAKWFAVWLVIYMVMGGLGGVFRSSPSHIPPGMTWVNSGDASSSTFYILRGGPHLILESNLHSQSWWVALLIGLAVMFMFITSQALKGKLKNKQGEPLPDWGQKVMAVLMVGVIVFVFWYGVGGLLKKETLELDPATHQVTLNGDYLCTFEQTTGFRAYTTHGSKGSINYHLVMMCAGEEIHLEGLNAHGDMDQTAGYLNKYLTEVRQQPSG